MFRPGELRDRREDDAAAGRAEDQRVGQLGVRRQIEARRRQVARALDQRLQLGLAVARDRDLGAQLLARVAQRLVDQRRRSGSAPRRAGTRRAPLRSARRRRACGRGRRAPARRAASRARAPGARCRRRGWREAPWCTRRPRGRSSWRFPRVSPARSPAAGRWHSRSASGQAHAERAIARVVDSALGRSGIGDIGPAGNRERERLIGQSEVFLEIREDERRAAALLFGHGQRLQDERICARPRSPASRTPAAVCLRLEPERPWRSAAPP